MSSIPATGRSTKMRGNLIVEQEHFGRFEGSKPWSKRNIFVCETARPKSHEGRVMDPLLGARNTQKQARWAYVATYHHRPHQEEPEGLPSARVLPPVISCSSDGVGHGTVRGGSASPGRRAARARSPTTAARVQTHGAQSTGVC